MSLTYREIAEIVKIIDSSSCDEVHVEVPGLKLLVRRRLGANGSAPVATAEAAPTAAALSPAPARPATEAPATSAPTKATSAVSEALTAIRAPMVGTFYRAPSPGAAPFVEVGAVVAKGDPLCLIEVMKLFTTITADAPGRIVEIAAGNGALVEYDQVLFLIEPV